MPEENPYKNPEVWGGIECSINRVGDRYFDQLSYSQHYKRPGDIKMISELGIKKIRYPILCVFLARSGQRGANSAGCHLPLFYQRLPPLRFPPYIGRPKIT